MAEGMKYHPHKSVVIILCLAAAAAFARAETNPWAEEPSARLTLPSWTLTQRLPALLLTPGENAARQVDLRVFDYAADEVQRGKKMSFLIAAVPVRRGEALRFTLRASVGAACLLACDRPLTPFDTAALMLSPEDSADFLPGRPVGFAMGGRETVLELLPATDGIWYIWCWALPTQLPATEPPPELDPAEIPPEMAEYMDAIAAAAKVEQLHSLDFVRAWRADKNTLNPRFGTAGKVGLNLAVETGGSGAAPADDLLYAAYIKVDSRGAAGLPAAVQNWREDMAQLAATRGLALETARRWAERDLHFEDWEGESNPIRTRISLILTSPIVQGPLLRTLQGADDCYDATDLQALCQRGLYGRQWDEAIILHRPASGELAAALAKVGVVGAALVTPQGKVAAATTPLVLPDISTDPAWADLAAKTTPVVSDPYVLNGYGFKLRKAAIPVRSVLDGESLGWLLAEVYAGPL